VIIDAHTHVFPPEVRDNREAYLERDATFRELYGRASTRIATAEELIASMEAAGIDHAIACAFAWSDAELCRQHSDYLLDAAARSNGQIIPFCMVQPSDDGARDELKRLATAGARGLGELRPQNQGYALIDSEEADLLAWGADAYDMTLLFHASEPVGHPYPGKAGLPLEQLARFVADFPGVTVIAAHWGGGLPFYALMPEVGSALEQTYFDTAGTPYLYRAEVYATGVQLAGAERVLFGSDFPLLSHEKALQHLREARLREEERQLIEGGNARRLLRL
jgi:predicted TIM-barrel fold metal-dependent hydrolase